MMIKHAKVFRADGTFSEGSIYISGERFASADPNQGYFDASACYAIPGLIDIHTHGCVGHDFADADVAALTKMARYQAANGITALCPTTPTLPEAALMTACNRLASYQPPADAAAFAGIHLEGPFFALEKIGAQNPAYVKLPDIKLIRRLQQAAAGRIKILSLAPELEGALDTIGAFSKEEVCCSLAHTMADYDTAAKAFSAGARQVSHLYNAMPPFHHRAPGVVGAAIDARHCRVELITDGVHVHPAMVRATFHMFGTERIILISDSMMATAMPDGFYDIGGLSVDVRAGRCFITGTDTIAGSSTNLMDCLRRAVLNMSIPLESAVQCASVNPAKAIGVFNERGSIDAGKYADLVLLSEDLSIRAVFVRGKILLS